VLLQYNDELLQKRNSITEGNAYVGTKSPVWVGQVEAVAYFLLLLLQLLFTLVTIIKCRAMT